MPYLSNTARFSSRGNNLSVNNLGLATNISHMKFNKILATTLLAAAATAAFAGAYEDQLAKVQTIKQNLEADVITFNTFSSVEQNVFNIFRQVEGYNKLSPDGKATIFAKEIRKVLTSYNGADKQLIEEYLKAFDANPDGYLDLVHKLEVVDRIWLEGVPNYNNEYLRLVKLIEKGGEALYGYRDQEVHQHLVQTGLTYDLLKDLNATAGNQGFVNFQGAFSKATGSKDAANFAHFGYKLQPTDNVALAGFVTTGLEKSTLDSKVTSKHKAVNLGLGFYAVAKKDNFQLSGLFQALAADTQVKNRFDFDPQADLVALELQPKEYYHFSAPIAKYNQADEVNVNKGVMSAVVKGEYAYKATDALTLTPALFFQATKTSSQYEITTGLQEYSVPSIFTKNFGAAVAVDYKVNPQLQVGGDFAVSYLKTSAGTYTQTTKEAVWTPPAGEELLFQTVYQDVSKTAPYKVNNVRIAAQAKLAYAVTPNATVTAKAGYSYLTKTKAHAGTYGLDVAFKF